MNKCNCLNSFLYNNNENRLGGFLLPFLTGAVVSAPFWYLGGVNKGENYYKYNPYPVYYPMYQGNYPNYPSYFPYPPYR